MSLTDDDGGWSACRASTARTADSSESGLAKKRVRSRKGSLCQGRRQIIVKEGPASGWDTPCLDDGSTYRQVPPSSECRFG